MDRLSSTLPVVVNDRRDAGTAAGGNLRAVSAAQRIVAELFGEPGERHFTVRYWNGAEEVGVTTHPRFLLIVRRPGGLFLNHGIISLDDARTQYSGAEPQQRLWGKGRFIDRYVFPNGELVSLSTAIGAGEAAGFESRDVESLREHYAETLRHWVRRLEQRSDEARALVGETWFRVWRLYMAASAHAFRTARIGVVQMLFARPTSAGQCCLPRTRADLYVPRRLAAS